MMLGPSFGDALFYASRLHAGQVRKGTTIPYISHLLGVCDLVLTAGGDETEAIAALLHDGPEDCGGKPILDQIATQFGSHVAAIVEGCSDSLVDTATEEKAPWRERKEEYIQRLRGEPKSVLLVSAADKLHNAHAIERDVIADGVSTFERFNGKRDGTLWYYHELVRAYKAAAYDARREPLVQELAEIVKRLERY